MTKKRGLHITEEVFCLAYKIALEFLYSGSAMSGSQDKTFQAIKGLLAPNSKPMEVVVTQESYYKKARGLMHQRKDEIKARLVGMDDKPSKRGELRAEMRAIDYCVSILDKYHQPIVGQSRNNAYLRTKTEKRHGGTFFCYCRIGICSICDTVQVWPESSFTRDSGFGYLRRKK